MYNKLQSSKGNPVVRRADKLLIAMFIILFRDSKKKTLSKNFHDDLYTSIKWSQADGCKECKTICTYKMYKYTDVSVPIKYTKGTYVPIM